MNPIFLTTNTFEFGALTATSSAAGYPVTNLVDRRNYTMWKANAHGTNYINIDHGGPTYDINGCAIFGHNFYSNSAVVTLQYYHDPPGEWEDVADFVITKDGATSLIFTTVTNGEQWRIKIVTSAGALPQIKFAIIGERTEFPYPADAPNSDFEEIALKESAVSKNANLLGIISRGAVIDVNLRFSLLSRSWVDAYILNWWWPNFGKKGWPFIFIPDYTNSKEDVFLVRAVDELRYNTPKSLLTYYDSIEFNLTGVRA